MTTSFHGRAMADPRPVRRQVIRGLITSDYQAVKSDPNRLTDLSICYLQNARKQRQEALAQLGAKEIPAAARKRTMTKLEAAQAALTLAALPKKLSCRDK